MFTNFWKNFVSLFAKYELVIGRFPSAIVMLFLRTCLCFLNSSHPHSKWSVVCGLVLQKHVGSSMILNLGAPVSFYSDCRTHWSVDQVAARARRHFDFLAAHVLSRDDTRVPVYYAGVLRLLSRLSCQGLCPAANSISSLMFLFEFSFYTLFVLIFSPFFLLTLYFQYPVDTTGF
jgi:hypothetical protein